MSKPSRKPPTGYLIGPGKGEATYGFVPHPVIHGMWVRVHPCVILAECGDCKSPPGVPCKSKKGKYWASSEHYRRRLAAPPRRDWPKSVINHPTIVRYEEITPLLARTKKQEIKMPIKLVKEPEEADLRSLGMERCCFCRKPTPYWTEKDVACCQDCAKTHELSEVPSKKQWFRNERIANHEYPCCGGNTIKGHTFGCRNPEPLVDNVHKLREEALAVICNAKIDPKLLPNEVSTDWRNVTCQECRTIASPPGNRSKPKT